MSNHVTTIVHQEAPRASLTIQFLIRTRMVNSIQYHIRKVRVINTHPHHSVDHRVVVRGGDVGDEAGKENRVAGVAVKGAQYIAAVGLSVWNGDNKAVTPDKLLALK
jgi:hypothetical protein